MAEGGTMLRRRSSMGLMPSSRFVVVSASCPWRDGPAAALQPATEARAKQCNMTYVYQGHIEKIPILEEILTRSGIPASQVAYIGDDLTDVVVMNRVGLGIAPANALGIDGVRGNALKDPVWQEFLGKAGPLLDEMHSTIMLPAPHSPLK